MTSAFALNEQDVLSAVTREMERSTRTRVATVKTVADVPLDRVKPSVALDHYDACICTAGGVRVLVLGGAGWCLVRVADGQRGAQGGLRWEAIFNDPSHAIDGFASSLCSEWERRR